MGDCNSWGIFWQTLPLTLPAIVAAFAAIRNGQKADKVAVSVNGHMTALMAKNDAYQTVIDDLTVKLAEADPSAVAPAPADQTEEV